jgi:hypothetical protein
LIVPTRDIIHEAVKNALVKDGWTITADPYTIEYEDVTLFADLGAERPLAAERAGRKIVVEVKSFLSPSSNSHFGVLPKENDTQNVLAGGCPGTVMPPG